VAAANYYELLHISPAASQQELRQAFRRLSKHYHPDTTSLPKEQAQEGFRRLQQAYFTLSDAQRRGAYDASLKAKAMAPVPVPVRPAAVRPPSVRRALSGGEWFALLLLALAVVFSLVLGVGVAWVRGAALLREPSWWPANEQTASPSLSAAADVVSAAPPGAAVQPSASGPGAVAPGAGSGAAGASLLPLVSDAVQLER
jgi:curved DNA-binding protein CbpA